MFGLEAKLLGLLGIAAALALGYHAVKERGRAECQASYAQAAIQGERENARTTILKHERNQEIADGLRRKAETEAARAAAAGRQLDELRDVAAAVARAASSAAPAASGADEAAGLRRLLAEGAELHERGAQALEEGRQRVVELTRQVTGWQEYAARVCEPAAIAP